jgi:two-component system, OmpR family, response regulator
MRPKVLAVDDDKAILGVLQTALEIEGYDVTCCTSISDFRGLVESLDFDLFLIDVTLPDGSGFSLVKELRRSTDRGIILLTGRSSETDQVVGLEIGADDYVTKPFRIRELAARVNAVYRRCMNSRPSKTVELEKPADTKQAQGGPVVDFAFEDYKLSIGARRLWNGKDVEIALTTAEFDLLVAFLRRRGHVLDRDLLMNATKGRDWESYDRAVDGLVSRLRKKIPSATAGAHFIRTVHGAGYTFTA